MPSPTLAAQQLNQVQRPKRQRRTRETNTPNWPAHTHIFYPFAIETAGTWHEMVIELTQEIGRITEDTRETTFLFQRLSMALQRGNAVSFSDGNRVNCHCNHNFVCLA